MIPKYNTDDSIENSTNTYIPTGVGKNPFYPWDITPYIYPKQTYTTYSLNNKDFVWHTKIVNHRKTSTGYEVMIPGIDPKKIKCKINNFKLTILVDGESKLTSETLDIDGVPPTAKIKYKHGILVITFNTKDLSQKEVEIDVEY